jgi:hypothetical protein
MSDIAFALNYTNLYEINTPGGWCRIGGGITQATLSGNEVTAQDNYYDGDGLASTDVTGGQNTFAFSGNRLYGDAAQDFIARLAMDYGAARKTGFRWTAPDGAVAYFPNATLANITPGGGDANAKGTFSFEVHGNGMPTVTAGDATNAPAGITASAVTVSVGQTANATASVTPSTANQAIFYAIEDTDIATVSSDGVVTGVTAGTTNLSVKAAGKPSVNTSVTVTVS